MTKRRVFSLVSRLPLVLVGTFAACGDGAAGNQDAAGGGSGGAGTGGSGGVTTSGTGGAPAGSGGASSGTGGQGGGPAATAGRNGTGSGGVAEAGRSGRGGGAAVMGGRTGQAGGEMGTASGGRGSGGRVGSGGAAGGDSGAGTGGATGGAPATGPATAFVNGLQWADNRGKPIQAHGGGVLKVGDDYYWFGENRNADSTFYAVSAYRSRDLRNWEYRADVLKMTSDAELMHANIERPKVAYNASTKKFVMWMHWENGKDYGEARAAVAVGDTVDGDYKYMGSARPFVDAGNITDHGKPGYMSRDCNLFVDDDGKAYFISATNENTDLNLYLLTDDYLSVSKLAATLAKGNHREAPVIFKRMGVYFLLSSAATGWDPNQAQYSTSTSLTSGWSSATNVGDGHTFYSQPTHVVAVQGTGGTEYLYLGDRWAGAWSGRVNDSSYLWAPITFSSTTKMSMAWDDTLTIDTTAGTVRGAVTSFRIINKKSGKALDVDGAATDNGAAIVQNAKGASGTTSQDWSLDYDAAGFNHLVNKKSSKILEVPNESTTDGATLDQWSSSSGDHQTWLIVDLGGGAYRIKNKKSNKYVGVAGAATTDGAAIEQRAMGSGDEQIWMFVPSGQ